MKGGGGSWEEATPGGLGMVAVTDALTTGSMVLCGGKAVLSITTGCFRVLCVATYSCRCPLLPSLRSSASAFCFRLKDLPVCACAPTHPPLYKIAVRDCAFGLAYVAVHSAQCTVQ